MRRSLLGIIVAASVVFASLAGGCSIKNEKSDRLSIVATSFPPYDFARAVVGDTADITMLLSTGAEAHSYEPTPLDIAKIQSCDVFVCIGGEDEVWVDKILDSIDTSEITVVRLFDYAELLEEEAVAGASESGHHHDHEHEHEHHNHDEAGADTVSEENADGHIWTSPENAIRCIKGIEEALCGNYSENAGLYCENASEYTDRLRRLDEEFDEMVRNAPENTIVIGDRFPFRYLAHEYDLEYFAAFSGCSSESEPSVYTMAYLMEEIGEHEMDTVFYLDFPASKLSEKLCSATGAKMLPLYVCHNVTKDEFENGVTYIDLMYKNLNNLREALY